MSWLNDFKYVEAQNLFECAEGEHDMCIRKIDEGSSKNGAPMLTIHCAVKESNGELWKLYLVAGDYFDKSLSRFLDCFGIPISQASNLNAWINKVGKGKFDHFKFDSQLKKTVTVQELQCHLIAKKGFE